MIWSWVVWISIMLIVLAGGYWYIGSRLIGTMNLSPSARTAALVGLAMLFLVPLLSMFLFRFMEGLGSLWAWITYVGLGFLSLVFTVLVVRDLFLLGAKGISALFLPSDAAPVDLKRRELLLQSTNFIVLGVAGALTGYGIYEARRRPGIVTVSVPLKNLPEAFEGFRIVQITDIHAGLTVKRDWVETIAQQVSDLKPDLIALTGDLVDGSVAHLRDDVAPLADLEAPHGKFFVTGNHEYYSGVEPWVHHVKQMGYDVLLNEHRLISRNGSSIVLAGVTDPTGAQFLPGTHAPNPQSALEGAPSDTIKILLAHQPKAVYDAQPLGFDLLMSGHTHGGQFFPWNLVAALGQPYIKGLHNHNGTWVYVSKGTGYWGPPVRLGARSEITVISLVRESASTRS
jgi:predicted MPP superfamily phosphohydrolase